MSTAGKSRKSLIIGIVAAVVLLAVLLVLLLTQCTGGEEAATVPSTTTEAQTETYELYWNLDRAEYDGKSEAGMSSRMPESDGYFHVRFFKDGETVELKVQDRKTINAIDINSLMGLTFDENGIVTGIVDINDMPLEKLAWQFYVQSAGGKIIKANSSNSFNGMEVMVEGDADTGVWDMTGKEGPVGTKITPIPGDRIYAVANLDGKVTHVFVYERPTFMETHEAECQHCKKVVTWSEWIREDAVPMTSGHYQLHVDIATKKQNSLPEDVKICLDLNGHRIDGGYGARVYSMHNVGDELAVMDTSEKQDGVIAAHGTKGEAGMCVWVRYGAFYLYSGILDASDAESIKSGTAVALQKNTYMYMFGGEIIGGTAAPLYNETTGKYSNGMAGSLCLNTGSKFVMHDGVIRDGYAKGVVTAWNKDGTPKTYQRGSAGNIFIATGAVMEMNGGTIKNGKAFNLAGNIQMDGTAELTINDGLIYGGQGMGNGKNGGSMFIGSKCTVIQNGGSILGGVTRNGGGNIYLNGHYIMNGGVIADGVARDFKTGKVKENFASRNVFVVNGRFDMYGGRVAGGFQATDSSATDNKKTTLVLSGYATIDGGEKSTANLTLAWGAGGPVKVLVGNLYDSAKIRVTATTGVFTEPTKQANVDNFASDIASAGIHYHEGCVALGRYNCICGSEQHFGACDGTSYLWAPHIATTSLPNKDGFFYLDKDVTMSGTNYLRGDESVHTRVDLNGKQILGGTGKNRVYSLFENTKTYNENGVIIPNIEGVVMALTVTDTAGGAKITLREHNDLDQGTMFWGRHIDSVINIYGGTFDGTAATSVRHNGAVVTASGELNMYGGHFIGGNSAAGGVIATSKATAVFNMTGGTIEGGVASASGGCVYLYNGSTFNFAGGTIKGGRAMNGGNISLGEKVTMKMTGGTIADGVVDNSAIVMDGGLGGNIYQANKSTFIMEDGVIENGYVRGGTKGGGHGGNLGYYGHVELLGGVIRGGKAHSAGGNVGTIASTATIVMKGVRLENGVAGGNGGNFAVHVRNAKAVEIGEGTVITGGKAASGGNIALRAGTSSAVDLKAVINGATIENGTATSYGGNIYIYNNDDGETPKVTDLTVSNTTLTGGKAPQGGNLYVEGNSALVLNKATLVDGQARQGGNLFVYNCKATLTDSVLDKGFAYKAGEGANGGNIFASGGATLDLVGTTVRDGLAKADTEKKYPTGGNIYFAGKSKLTLDENTLITGGQTLQTTGNWTAGGNIYAASGTLDINGATIENGLIQTNGQSHNIHVINGCVVNFNSGLIKNTQPTMQSVYFEGGEFNMYGGEMVNTATGSRNVSSKADVGGVFNLYGGTISGGNYTTGGNVYIPSGFTFNIKGGTVTGGVATTDHGGNIRIASGGVLNIESGTVSDGTAYLYGGNLMISGGAKVNMTGGTVSGGKNQKSGENGGSIYLAKNAEMDLSGGTIQNGTSVNLGGNIYMQGTLKISGDAYITGGTNKGNGSASGNIANVNGKLLISGGVIDGDVGCTNSGSAGVNAVLSGKVTINRGKVGGLYLSSYNYDYPATFTIDGVLADGSHVVVSSKEQTVITTNATVQENVKFFEPQDPSVQIIWLEKDKDMNGDGSSDLHKLFYGLTYCICGVDSDDPADHLGTCGGELLVWKPWSNKDRLPTEDGNWYLTVDVEYEQANDTADGKEFNQSGVINIDLNGHTVSTTKALRIFRVRNGDETTNTHISVTDTLGGGKIVQSCAKMSDMDGGIVWLTQDTHSFSLYGGTLDASLLSSNREGTAIKANRGVVNIYGGTVKGGTLTDNTRNGAAVNIGGYATLNMTGGTVTGGFNANQAGTLAVYGQAFLTGGELGGGTAKNGTAISVIRSMAEYPAKLVLSGTTVDGSMRINSAAGPCDITLSGKVVLEKGEHQDYGIGSTGSEPAIMKVSGLTDGSSIDIMAAGYFAEGANETIRGYFHPTDPTTQVILDGDKLFAGRDSCLCGKVGGKCITGACDGTVLRWTPWTSTGSLPTTTGNYYLTGPVTTGANTITSGNKVNLDLNGYEVKCAGRAYSARLQKDVVLQITDTSATQTGKFTFTGTNGDQGAIWVHGENTIVRLIRGTLDGSKRTLTGNAGAVICVQANCVFDMYGGTILGGSTTGTSAGGAIAVVGAGGQANLYGGTVKGGSSAANGGTVFVSNGTVNLKGATIEGGSATYGGAVAVAGGKFNYESGTLSGGTAERGGVVVVTGGEFNLDGGTITGGTATDGGSNVYITGGTFNHKSGSVEKGTGLKGGNVRIEGGTYNLTGGSVSGGDVTANGGNVLMVGGTFHVNGGSVTGGKAKENGGNVYIALGTLKLTSGSITGGVAGNNNTAAKNAGNVLVDAGGTFRMEGGTVTGGSSNNSGGNIHVYGNLIMTGGTVSGGTAKNTSSNNIGVQGGTFRMEGGKVEGHITVVNSSASMNSKVILKGSPVISGGTQALKLTRTDASYTFPVISVEGTLGSGARIEIDKDTPDATITDATGAASKAAFVENQDYREIYAMDDGTLYLGKYGCICGGLDNTPCAAEGHPKVKWTAWTSATVAPGGGTSTTLGTPGNYYLTKSVSTGGKGDQHYAYAGQVNIDLNGYNITSNGDRLFRMRNDQNSTPDYALTIGIKNSRNVENGGIMKSNQGDGKASHGYIAWLGKASHVFNLYGGTIDGSGVTGDNTGGAISISGGTFNMYGGEIKNGSASGKGGNIRVGGSSKGFNLYGGTVSGGSATAGGNILIEAGGTATLAGGTVSGGTSTAGCGSIYVAGDLVLKGATVENGHAATNAGNILVISGGELTMTSGKISGGKASGVGGNLYVLAGGRAFLNGGTITGGTDASTDGGNLYIEGEVTLNGATLEKGAASANGGNICVSKGGNLHLISGQVVGGSSKAGGAIYTEGTVELKGATVKNGAASATGGNIHVGDEGTLIMTSGHITGGNAAGDTVKDHENVYCRKGTLDLQGGTIDGFVMVHFVGTEKTQIKLSGDPKIVGGTRNLRLVLDSSVTDARKPSCVIQLGELKEEAEIGIFASQQLFATGQILIADKDRFQPDQADKQVVLTEEGLKLVPKTEIWQCVCGGKAVGVGDHKCVDVKWQEWTSTAWPTETGNYKLINGIKAGQYTLNGGKVMNFDLNGKNIQATGTRVAIVTAANTVLSITDSTNTPGSVIGKGTGDQGGTIIASQGAILNIYDGTITNDHSNTGGVGGGGGVLYVNSNTGNPQSYIKMYGGTVTGGETVSHGGNIYIRTGGNFVMYKGTVSNGKSTGTNTSGGNVYVSQGGQMIMHGGEIFGGTATNKGGNVMIIGSPSGASTESKFVMNGGTISGGEAVSGAGVAVNAQEDPYTSVFEMNGGTISGGAASKYGGALYINALRDTAVIGHNATITAGTATTAGPCVYNNGGNLTVSTQAKVDGVVAP